MGRCCQTLVLNSFASFFSACGIQKGRNAPKTSISRCTDPTASRRAKLATDQAQLTTDITLPLLLLLLLLLRLLVSACDAHLTLSSTLTLTFTPTSTLTVITISPSQC